MSPPLVVALAKSELVKKCDMSSLRNLGCDDTLLENKVSKNFRAKFPNMKIGQVSELLYY